MEKMDMDHDGNVGGDEFLATLIDWGQVRVHSSGFVVAFWMAVARGLACRGCMFALLFDVDAMRAATIAWPPSLTGERWGPVAAVELDELGSFPSS
jgi:hypothetical protein